VAGAVDGGAGSACEPARKRTARLSSVLIYFLVLVLIIIQVLRWYCSATDTVASSSSATATVQVVPVPGYYCTAVPGSSACVHCISML
jgi:uncharacterized membrane protein